MRIRRHANHDVAAGSGAGFFRPSLCVLNQSPWDVIPFSPDSPLQVRLRLLPLTRYLSEFQFPNSSAPRRHSRVLFDLGFVVSICGFCGGC